MVFANPTTLALSVGLFVLGHMTNRRHIDLLTNLLKRDRLLFYLFTEQIDIEGNGAKCTQQ